MSLRLQRATRALFVDDLFSRVLIFMTGTLFLAVPLLALGFDVITRSSDSALLVLISILVIVGSFFIYASTKGSDRLIERTAIWSDSGELLILFGLLTLAIPITLLIRYFRPRTDAE